MRLDPGAVVPFGGTAGSRSSGRIGQVFREPQLPQKSLLPLVVAAAVGVHNEEAHWYCVTAITRLWSW